MKTKFILHGGSLDDEYFTELTKHIPNNGNILMVYFASQDERAKEKYERDSNKLQILAGTKILNIIKATEENFINQISNADVIYLAGGDTEKLKNSLKRYPDFCKTLKGKIISGSSAGAYVLSTYYFTNSKNKVIKGYGCAPVRVACHYKSKVHPIPKNADPIGKLEKYDNNLELVVLKDYEWKTVEICD